ncbi:glycerol dehydrogenase [Halanaerobium sp. Z-7514]|uniref:Glycerol dehydrogenase n=1 Tax=Halanaerobium polyolivorans TaxID=2886943 RepID=A0AAW4X0V7_9FIRM|nr:glycerol dehydrogenase [Halanaerobium polyolivorans]MCC3145444.1 glycerol dehydrogenase [Halanaerobium polyolivorans]RQD77925.1 MAG: glycerol dehydrogenase [Halanaerobium sp. MSAO_Bac5]
MARVLQSPGKYVQGKNVIAEMADYLQDFGEKVLVIADPVVDELFSEELESGLEGKDVVMKEFNGECSKLEIDRLQAVAEAEAVEMVIGVGGGKTLDTAKAVAYYAELPVVIVPTIAATDAPCSALSVIYTEEGVFEEYLFLPKNPDVVIIDTQIVADAPVRFLVSGMGDALATYFEAAACDQTKAPTIAGGSQTMTAVSLARLSYDTLLKYGKSAKSAAEAGVVTEALEKVVEANTLLSGLGFESGGLAAAHAIHNGLTVLEETHSNTHGEKVAFATIVQMVLEDRDPVEIEQVIAFCKTVGLPTKLADLGVTDVKEDKILEVAKASTAEGETIHNMPFEVDAEMVKDAILAANNL